MAASGARAVPITSKTLPKTFQSVVIFFDDAESAGAAFDVMGQGGQYGIVGRYKYVVTPHHISLLEKAGIHYDVESYRQKEKNHFWEDGAQSHALPFSLSDMATKALHEAKIPPEFMYRFDVWLPLNDKDGAKVPRHKFAQFEAEIYDRFKGLTRTPITGNPVYEGYWEDDDSGTPARDVNTIYTILTAKDDASYEFFIQNKDRWAAEFGHKKVLITLYPIEALQDFV